jgi:hypothetical protein
VRVGLVGSELMLASRVDAAAATAGATLVRVDDPAVLPGGLDLVLVDWSERRPGWDALLRGSDGARVILFGPHTDLDAHAAARAAGLGPMWARSKLLSELATLLSGRPHQTAPEIP